MDPAELFSHHRTSPEYIQQLEFDYIETYSFQRGVEYERPKTEFSYLNRLNNRSIEQQQRFQELLNFRPENGFLLSGKGQFNKSAVRIARFNRDEPEPIAMLKALNIEAANVLHWMCAPVYRDAIVFYKASG